MDGAGESCIVGGIHSSGGGEEESEREETSLAGTSDTIPLCHYAPDS